MRWLVATSLLLALARCDDAPPAAAPEACVTAGCSSELCVPASQADLVSACEYRCEYGCNRHQACERQESGHCGWTVRDPDAYAECVESCRSAAGGLRDALP